MPCPTRRPQRTQCRTSRVPGGSGKPTTDGRIRARNCRKRTRMHRSGNSLFMHALMLGHARVRRWCSVSVSFCAWVGVTVLLSHAAVVRRSANGSTNHLFRLCEGCDNKVNARVRDSFEPRLLWMKQIIPWQPRQPSKYRRLRTYGITTKRNINLCLMLKCLETRHQILKEFPIYCSFGMPIGSHVACITPL